MATVATKLLMIFRKRGLILAVISALSAIFAAKGGGPVSGPIGLGFFDGPSGG